MAQSIEKNITAAKIGRSRALMQKINVLYTRDGSDAPPIESLEEQDDFNTKLFFGKSGNENIDWNSPGVEGIIRMYYEISKFLKGTVRNNIIKEGGVDSSNTGHNSTTRSGLTRAAQDLQEGKAFESGFFVGWEGLDREVNNASGTRRADLSMILNMGRKGDFQVKMTEDWPSYASSYGQDVTSSTFLNNRDTIPYLDTSSSPPRWRAKWPDDDANSVTYLIDKITTIIGQRSPLGQKPASNYVSASIMLNNGWIHDSVMGRRLADVYPQKVVTTERWGVDTITDPETGQTFDEPWSTSSTTYSYGNDIYDKSQSLSSNTDVQESGGGLEGERITTEIAPPSGYDSSFLDYWDDRINSSLTAIKSLLTQTKTFIDYTKVNDDSYLINPNIPPGKDEAWAMQNKWHDEIDYCKNLIDQFLSDISPYYSGGGTTSSSGRDYLNSRLDVLLSELADIRARMKKIGDVIDSNSTDSSIMVNNPIFGDVAEAETLYGLRFLATRMIIDSADGSKTAVESIGVAIAMMDKKLQKAEEELRMYGIPEYEWIYTPEIVGIEPYYRLNQATMEMETAGWMVVCAGQDHCTAYDFKRSLDYDPATGEGAWIDLIPAGQNHTVVDRDANSGKVLSYYIDKEIEPGQEPYYMAKAYDDGTGEKSPSEYNRIATESKWSEPKSAAEIEAPVTPQERPRKIYEPNEPVVINRAASIPPNTLAWTTNWKGSEAEDIDRTLFKSEVPFDSIASNLMVFVNERFKSPDKNGETNDYWIDDTYTVRFHESVEPNDEISLHVFIRSFEGKEQCVDVWYDLVDELPGTLESDTVAYVRNDRKYYQFDGSFWNEISDPCAGTIDQWKQTVDKFENLPTVGNSDGDMRLVLDENIIYRWDGGLEEWLMISGSNGSGYWRSPVDTFDELPVLDSNKNGEIRFVIETSSLYRWNENTQEWDALTMGGSGGGSAIWGEPVPSFLDLPDPATQLNEVRLVLDEKKLYIWDATDAVWMPVYAEARMNHDDLEDMVGGEELHDDRYYREDEMDSFLQDIKERVNYLEELKPRDAQELSGDFTITGTKFYSGYLSDGHNIRFETLLPNQYFQWITFDSSFVLHNDNLEQFKDADKGVLKLYINDIEVDNFDLSSNFIEDERDDGQTWTPASSTNGKIVITSVQPYNNYPLYQRGDYELHFTEDDFESGENKIQFIHTLEIDQGLYEDRKTNEFVFFYDTNKSYRGFQSIETNLINLTSEKYLSGIRYLSLGDSFNLKFYVERMFNNTYPMPKQVEVDGSDFGIDLIELNHESDGVNEVTPFVYAQYQFDKNFTIDKIGVYSVKPNLILQPYTVKGKDPKRNWSSSNFLINTINQKSDDKNEYFLDEVYRLPNDDYDIITSITGMWDSTKLLDDGELQVFNGLIYPQNLYNDYIPTQAVDYRNFINEASYIRAFRSDAPHNNGEFFVEGYQHGMSSIRLEIKIPGQTGWLNLSSYYNAVDFTGSDGDGCLVKEEFNNLHFTTGEFNTAYSDNIILLKITFIGTNISTLREEKITRVSINW